MIPRMPPDPAAPGAASAPSPSAPPVRRARAVGFLVLCAAIGLAVGTLAWSLMAGDGADGAPVAAPAPAAAPDALLAPRLSFHEGIVRAVPSVVSVYARVPGAATVPVEPDPRPVGAVPAGPQDTSQGSGVIVGEDGTILTNLHLVDGASGIGVQLPDGSLHAGRLIGTDPETDLAVLRIDAGSLPALTLGAAPPLKVGDVVLAIGNPFGVGQTVTQGIVSATRRRVAGASAWQHFVQIDAAINPGSSGGALIDPLGRLVGVTTAVLQRGDGAQGIGFAIPAELLAQVVPRIVAEGRVVRGWLGIGADDLDMFPDLGTPGDAGGAVITDVLPGSPAALAGLSRRDVVTAVDGAAVGDATSLLLAVSARAPGSAVELALERAGRAELTTVVLGERPDAPRAGAAPPSDPPSDPPGVPAPVAPGN